MDQFRVFGLLLTLSSLHIVQGVDVCGAGKCYSYKKIRSSFTEAGDSCRSAGKRLATVTSLAEQTTLSKAMTDNGVTVTWLDVREEEGYKTSWRWLDGSLLQAQGCYYEYYGSRSFINYTAVNALTPTKCIDACKAKNFLYSSLQEGSKCYCGNTPSNYLTDSGCTTPCAGDSEQWCGAYGKGFVYYNYGTYGDWAYNQPNNQESREDCAALLSSDDYYRFSDRDCTDKLLYVCDIADTSACTSTPTKDTNGYFIQTSSKCVYVGTVAVPWYTAVTECTNREGMLAIIKTRAEHDVYQAVITNMKNDGTVATTLAGPMLWIGLQKRMFRSHYSSGAGGPSNPHDPAAADSIPLYYNFADGQPDWFMWRCVQVNGTNNNKWMEVSCDVLETNVPFFCESDAPTTTSATTSTTTTAVAPSTTETATTSTSTTTTTATTSGDGTGGEPDAGASTGTSSSLTTLEIVFLILCLLLLIALVAVIIAFIMYKKKNNDRNRIEPEHQGRQYASQQPAHYDGRDTAKVATSERISPGKGYSSYGDSDSTYSAETQDTGAYGSRQGIFIKDKDMFH